jgi:hypothetical protein
MPFKKHSSNFPEALVKHWEKSDGVNFAIALGRLTGWMLQVDWLASEQHSLEADMTPVRVYVETNNDVIFDFTGKKSMKAFHKYVILPIGIKRSKTRSESIDTRCYSEQKLREMPLKVKATEYEIEKATKAILANPSYLSFIPKRQNPDIPAHIASQFSHGRCVPFAEALKDLSGLTAVGISVIKYNEDCANQLGFCHTVIQHTDGLVEDAWGKQTLQQVLDRFYIDECEMSQEIFDLHRSRQQHEFPEIYKEAYEMAKNLLQSIEKKP